MEDPRLYPVWHPQLGMIARLSPHQPGALPTPHRLRSHVHVKVLRGANQGIPWHMLRSGSGKQGRGGREGPRLYPGGPHAAQHDGPSLASPPWYVAYTTSPQSPSAREGILWRILLAGS